MLVESAFEASPPPGVEEPVGFPSPPVTFVLSRSGVCVSSVAVDVAGSLGVTVVPLLVDPEFEKSPSPGVDDPVVFPFPPVVFVVSCPGVCVASVAAEVACSEGIVPVSPTVDPASEISPPGVEELPWDPFPPVTPPVVSWLGDCVLSVASEVVCSSGDAVVPVTVGEDSELPLVVDESF